MIEKIIRKYVENLKIEDIYHFAEQNGILLSNEEAHYLYHTIQTKWKNVVFGSKEAVLKDAALHLNEKTYQKAEELLYFYLEKYKRYL